MKKWRFEDVIGFFFLVIRQLECGEYQIFVLVCQKMIKYLVEFIVQFNECYLFFFVRLYVVVILFFFVLVLFLIDLCCKVLILFYNFLQFQYWGDFEVDLFFNVIDFVFVSDKVVVVFMVELFGDKESFKFDDKFIINIINILQVVWIIFNFKFDDWIQKNMIQIQWILEKCFKCENFEIQDCLYYDDGGYYGDLDIKLIVKCIFDVVFEDVFMEDVDVDGEIEVQIFEIIIFLFNIVIESMNVGNYVFGINILWFFGCCRFELIDQYIFVIMKLLQVKLVRDYVFYYVFVV